MCFSRTLHDATHGHRKLRAQGHRERAAITLLVTLLAAGCRRGNAAANRAVSPDPNPVGGSIADRAPSADHDPTSPAQRLAAELRAQAASAAPAPTVTRDPPPAWCVRAMPLADARAIDRQGHVWALANGALRDETAGIAAMLPRADRCGVDRSALGFEADGGTVVLDRGRLYVRPEGARTFAATDVCTDLDGAPWTRTRAGGWAIPARRLPGGDARILRTDDRTGLTGWAATRFVDPESTAAILDADESIGVLTSGGHFVVIDSTNYVAGEVIATNGRTYASLTRTPSGLCAARDEGDAVRDVITSTVLTRGWRRQTSPRVAGSRTQRVFAADYGRLVASTDLGVEQAEASGAFVEVARWSDSTDPPVANAAPPALVAPPARRYENPSLGWFTDGSVAIVTRGAVAGRCESLRQALPR